MREARAFPKNGIAVVVSPVIHMVEKIAGYHPEPLHPVELILADRLTVDDHRAQILVYTDLLDCMAITADHLFDRLIAVGVDIDLPVITQTPSISSCTSASRWTGKPR